MSKLSELLNERNRQRWSAREIGRRAEAKGFKLSEANAVKFMSGIHSRQPRLETLEAIAAVLPVSIEEMRLALDLPADPGQPWIPPDEARQLTPDQRAALGQLIKTMVKEQPHEVLADDPAQKTPQPDNVRPLTAKHRRILDEAQPETEAAYGSEDDKPEGEL